MIRILIADDHPIIRSGLKQIIAACDDMVVTDEAGDGDEVLQKLGGKAIDALVLDMSMPGKSGIDLIKQIKAEKPKLPILILSVHKEAQYAVRTLKAGASGYLCKDGASHQLVQAIRQVAAGKAFVSDEVAGYLAQAVASKGASLEPHTRLSDREFEVFLMIVRGRSVSEIADELALSAKTVSTHKMRILEKMEMDNAAELVRYAIHHELVDDAGPGRA